MQSDRDAEEEGFRLIGAGLAIDGRTILSDLDLHLTERRVGIVGRNGSGKTSLLRLLSGLVPATAGTVRVEGSDPAVDRAGILRRIGILFQNPDHQIIFPTVGEEISFGLRQQGLSAREASERTVALLDRHGRSHWQGVSVSSLSHGQRQFLCLLALLAMKPRTLLLDEPFAGLDLPTQHRLGRELDGLEQRIVLITHDPAALAGADRVIWIEGGRVRSDGPARDVLAAFATDMEERGSVDADTDLRD